MRFLLLALALVSAAPAFAGDGPCKDSAAITESDSIQAARAKLLVSGLFPVYSTHPQDVPDRVRKLGFFEFSICQHSSAFKGCYSNWLTRSGENVMVAFPADGRLPFIADCPASMREN